jgi:hypothetical protein
MNDTEEDDGVLSASIPIDDIEIDIEVFVDPDENTVYVKFANFEDLEDAEEYATYLVEKLPLLLFQSRTIH